MREQIWVQMTLKEYDSVMEVEKKKEGLEQQEVKQFVDCRTYHHVNTHTRRRMVEVNIFDLPFQREGQLSVQNQTGHKLVIFGQDETIFCTSQLNNNAWYIDDQTSLQSKKIGVRIMVSSFCSNRFGFGMDMTEGDLSKVNTYQNRKNMQKKKLRDL